MNTNTFNALLEVADNYVESNNINEETFFEELERLDEVLEVIKEENEEMGWTYEDVSDDII